MADEEKKADLQSAYVEGKETTIRNAEIKITQLKRRIETLEGDIRCLEKFIAEIKGE